MCRLNQRTIAVLLCIWLALPIGTLGAANVPSNVAEPNLVRRAITEKAILRDGGVGTPAYLPPPASAGLRAQSTTFAVQYANFPADAQASFQRAVNIWQELITSSVPIQVVAIWSPLSSGVLGMAAPYAAFGNFQGAPQRDLFYPSALANKLAGRDLATDEPDIVAVFNSDVSTWYFGSGQTPTGQSNFTSTVLHEIGHGLGFLGTALVEDGVGSWGFEGIPDAYDPHVVNGSGIPITDTSKFPNPSQSLAAQLTSNNLFFNGLATNAANGGSPAKLYAPTEWDSGSSYGHLDEATYPDGSPNSLMTPKLGRGVSLYHPGPVALGILADMGWTVTSGQSPQPSPSSSPSTGGPQHCFPETGKCLSGRFLQQWQEHGGLAINGFPLTDERVEKLEDGKEYVVQWFERVRMEKHPENSFPNDVLLGQFGRAIHPADPPVARAPSQHYFPETGHNVPNDIMAFWDANGGLPQFGFPLSEVLVERLEDGKEYEVQYFERARIERHPENGPPHNILLGQFGRRILNGLPGPGPSPSPSPGGNVIFQDDFTNPNSGWPIGKHPEGHYESAYLPGEYRIALAAADYRGILTNRNFPPQANVRLEADMTRFGTIQEPLFGFACRAYDLDNYYGAVIGTDGFALLFKFSGGKYVEFARAQNHPAIKRGNATNRVRFDCVGTQLTLYANDVPIASVQDGEFTGGQQGFLVYSFDEGGLDLHIRNFIAYRP